MLKIMSFLLDTWVQGASRDLLVTSESKLEILVSNSDKNFDDIFRSHLYITKDTHSALWARPWKRSQEYEGWLYSCLIWSSGSAYDWIRRGHLENQEEKKDKAGHEKVYSFLCSTFPKPTHNTESTDNYRYREDVKASGMLKTNQIGCTTK